MKSIILFLILFITLLTISKSIMDDFSIEPFKDKMQKEGLFDIILSIKEFYGQDIAIISCEELNKNNSGNCRKLVIDYMPQLIPLIPAQNTENQQNSQSLSSISIMKPSSKSQPKSDENKKLKLKNILIELLEEKLTLEQSELISDNILKEVENRNITI